MFLLVSGRQVGAHPDGHQHGVSIQSSVNLGKHTSANSTRMKNSRELILGEVVYIAINYSYPRFLNRFIERLRFLFLPMTDENRELGLTI